MPGPNKPAGRFRSFNFSPETIRFVVKKYLSFPPTFSHLPHRCLRMIGRLLWSAAN